MLRFTYTFNKASGSRQLVEDPEGEWVSHEDALLHGSEQFGLGRIEGQADAQAVARILEASSRPDPLTLRLD